MTDLNTEFKTSLVPAHALLMKVLGMGRSAAYDLLGEFDVEFKRQRGVGLPRAGRSNALLIDRERFDLLRLARRDFEVGSFGSYRDALRYHLNPSASFVVDLESLSTQIRDAHAEISLLRHSQGDTKMLIEQVASMLKENQALVAELKSSLAEVQVSVLPPRGQPVALGTQAVTGDDESQDPWDLESVVSS
ncbi:hypothetical protein [Deinococcus sp. UYEF24]